MNYIPNYEQAVELLKKYNQDEFHIKHGLVVGGVMKYFAEKYDPDNVDFWEVVGVLHDLDFGLYPDEHCVKQVEIMRAEDIDDSVIYSTTSHGYGLTGSVAKPEKKMEKDKKFAAGCSREVIQSGADELGWTLDELIGETILAMRTLIPTLNI